jgi:hypothetical protein
MDEHPFDKRGPPKIAGARLLIIIIMLLLNQLAFHQVYYLLMILEMQILIMKVN